MDERVSVDLYKITVCICTFRRPERLARLLLALETQLTHQQFVVSVVVVDNDYRESSRETVEAFVASARIPVAYVVEPEQNISLARNRAVRQADGDFVALIDDDELPSNDWLSCMFGTLMEFKADGVMGPVVPAYAETPPAWLVQGKFCERHRYEQGTVLRQPSHIRTGNALIHRRVLLEEKGPFDPRFGLTGGEDVEFFGRRLRKGDRYVWCDEAPVFEHVPAERMTRAYLTRRALLRGVANAEMSTGLNTGVLKSLVAVLVYTAMLPVLIVFSHHLFMRFLVRDCDHLGKLFALCGVRLVRGRKNETLDGADAISVRSSLDHDTL